MVIYLFIGHLTIKQIVLTDLMQLHWLSQLQFYWLWISLSLLPRTYQEFLTEIALCEWLKIKLMFILPNDTMPCCRATFSISLRITHTFYKYRVCENYNTRQYNLCQSLYLLLWTQQWVLGRRYAPKLSSKAKNTKTYLFPFCLSFWLLSFQPAFIYLFLSFFNDLLG